MFQVVQKLDEKKQDINGFLYLVNDNGQCSGKRVFANVIILLQAKAKIKYNKYISVVLPGNVASKLSNTDHMNLSLNTAIENFFLPEKNFHSLRIS